MIKNILFGLPQFYDWNSKIKLAFKKLNIEIIFDEMNDVDKMNEIIKKNEIDLIIPCSYNQVIFLIKHKTMLEIGKIKIFHHQIESDVKIFNEKCEFAKFMTEHFPEIIPKTYLIKYNNVIYEYAKPEYPVILKLNEGHSGEGIFIRNNCSHPYKSFIVQELIYEKREYSGHLVLNEGNIIFSRYFYKDYEKDNNIQKGKLNNYKTEYNFLEEHEKVFSELFNKLKYTGIVSINFKIVNNKIKIFEVNPRLGGTIVNNCDLDKLFKSIINIY